MLEQGMCQESPAGPAHQGVAAVLCGVQQAGLSAENPQIDLGIASPGRRIASKDRIVLPSSAVKHLARGNSVRCLCGSQQRYFRDERLAVEMRDAVGL